MWSEVIVFADAVVKNWKLCVISKLYEAFLKRSGIFLRVPSACLLACV